MKARRSIAGVTLVELMIVVVIISILGLIAVPSYRFLMMRTQRTAGPAALEQLLMNQEKFYLQNNTYSANVANVGFPGGGTVDGLYAITIEAADAQGFRATATPGADSAMQADDDCQEFAIDQTGELTATPNATGKCL